MSHPIFEANESSPYGDLSREQFFNKHKILHQENFMLNKEKLKIYTQSWKPDPTTTPPPPPLRGVVAMIHGYKMESSWLFELNAVAIAKAGFLVCALDIQGHGYSQGTPGHIPNLENIISDCIQFFDTIKVENPTLPAFLYGESLGGAIAILVCLKQRENNDDQYWKGMVLSGPMCGISRKFKPIWPLEKLLPLVASIAPSFRIVITKPLARKSFKESWKGKLIGNSPNKLAYGKPTAATALQFLRACDNIQKNCHMLRVPLLIVHGAEDRVCDPEAANSVFELVGSDDKTFKIFDGMWHQLIGEPNEKYELVFDTIMTWLQVKVKTLVV
ncbi:hypothetical protein Leryth_022649 [Lithospermum erythrorhizon]|nr:hypothetical protein Leryth_022649 [Lithospermum erythrorhizon]